MSKAGNSKDRSPGGRRQHGFIAQEAEQVASEVVAEDGNGYKTVAYSRLVPALAAALSAVLDRVDKLERLEAGASPVTPTAATATPIIVHKPAAMNSERGNADGGHGSMGGRRMADVAVRGGQKSAESSSGPAFDLLQLRVENTALRVRVDEMEKRMAEVERNLEVLTLSGLMSNTPPGASADAS